ncbi:MAG TPA: hypothetical protein VFQ61_35875 [Polyangiaceae bacterium]|nr:hypothetical protein [Polyangiaceae bacterium]
MNSTAPPTAPLSNAPAAENGAAKLRRRFVAWSIDLACTTAPLFPLPFLQWESSFEWPSFYHGPPGGAWGGLERALSTFASVSFGVLIVLGLNTISVVRHRCTLGMAYAGLSISGTRLWRWALSYFVAGPIVAGAAGYLALNLDAALGSGWLHWDLPDHAGTWLLFVMLWLLVQVLPMLGRQRRTLFDHLARAHLKSSKLSDYGRYSRRRSSRGDWALMGGCLGVVFVSVTDMSLYFPCFVGGMLGFSLVTAIQVHAYRARGGMLVHLARATARE